MAADIARGTLGANIANQQADNALAAERAEQAAADRAASRDVAIRGQDVSRQNTLDTIAARPKPRLKRVKASPAAQQKAESSFARAMTLAQAMAHGEHPTPELREKIVRAHDRPLCEAG